MQRMVQRYVVSPCMPSLSQQLLSQKKVKLHLRTVPEEDQRFSSTPNLTSALDRGKWSTPTPSRFTPWKETQYPLNKRLDGPQGRCGLVRTIKLPNVSDFRSVHSVASRYTDFVIPDICYSSSFLFSCFGQMVKYVELPCRCGVLHPVHKCRPHTVLAVRETVFQVHYIFTNKMCFVAQG